AAKFTRDFTPALSPYNRFCIVRSEFWNLIASANFSRCSNCWAVGKLPDFLGRLLMTSIPRQLAPTTVPTVPLNPPRIPFLIVPIVLNLFVRQDKYRTVKNDMQVFD